MRRDRKILRLRDYDYSRAGGYFITVCTYHRDCVFGEVMNQQMRLNKVGEIVEQWWLKLGDAFPKTTLDHYATMPNHFHGVIMITDRSDVGAIHELPLQGDRITRRRMLIPKMVGYFKMNSSKYVNRLMGTPGTPLWQRNYYEHVIRTENELNRIREYMENNALKWDLDRENPRSRNYNLDHDLYWKEVYDST